MIAAGSFPLSETVMSRLFRAPDGRKGPSLPVRPLSAIPIMSLDTRGKQVPRKSDRV